MLLSKLSQFSCLTSSLSGADNVIRLLAYSLKLISSWIQWKASSRSLSTSDLLKVSVIIRSMRKLYSLNHGSLLVTQLKSNQATHPHQTFPDASSLELAGKLDRLVASLMESRTVLRLFGTASSLVDMHATSTTLLGLLKTSSLSTRDSYPALALWLQSLTMLFYYPCDHLYWLWSKGALKSMSESTANLISQWSCRGWTAYILLDLLLIAKDLTLFYRSKQSMLKHVSSDIMATSPPMTEPFDDSVSLHTSGELLDAPSLVSITSSQSPQSSPDPRVPYDAMVSDPKFRDLALRVLINLGDLPLALHWSFDQCQLPAMAVALCGTVSSFAGLYRKWNAS